MLSYGQRLELFNKLSITWKIFTLVEIRYTDNEGMGDITYQSLYNKIFNILKEEYMTVEGLDIPYGSLITEEELNTVAGYVSEEEE